MKRSYDQKAALTRPAEKKRRFDRRQRSARPDFACVNAAVAHREKFLQQSLVVTPLPNTAWPAGKFRGRDRIQLYN